MATFDMSKVKEEDIIHKEALAHGLMFGTVTKYKLNKKTRYMCHLFDAKSFKLILNTEKGFPKKQEAIDALRHVAAELFDMYCEDYFKNKTA